MPLNELSELGFVKNSVVETIVSTYDKERNPNAAPMGVYTEDMKNLILNVYKTSQTYENLMRWKSGVVNITSDPNLYYRTTFKDVNPSGKLPEEWFVHASTVDAPNMLNTDACIEFNIINVEESEEKVKIQCRIEKILLIERRTLPAYSRATSAVIESLIHATRIENFLSSGEEKKAKERIDLVNHYSEVVNKVAPNSIYSDIIEDIKHRIKKWKRKD